MATQRFNWIVLLCGGGLCLAIGVLGVVVGDGSRTVVWFVFGTGSLVGALVLKRMRLP